MEKATEFQKNIYFCFIDYAKAFDSVNHNILWKILKQRGIPDHLTCLLRTCMQVKKQRLQLDMEQWTGSRLGKEYIKTVYCHPVYLTSMQSVLVVHWLSCVQLFATPWTAARQASLSFTTSQSLLKLMSNESVIPSNHLVLCCPFILLPSIFPSIKGFSSGSWVGSSYQVGKVLELQLQHQSF